MQKGQGLILLIVGILIILGIATGAYYLGRSTSPKSSGTPAVASPIPQPTPTTNVYKKRQFNPNKTIAGTKFYQDKVLTILQSINDTDLVGMNCTPTYHYSDNNFSYFNKDSNNTQVTDPQTISKLSNSVQRTQNNVPGKTVSALTICDTEDNRTIVIYETILDQFGSPGGIYLGLDNTNSVSILANIKNRMYERCVMPLQLTKTNQLFYECVQAETLGGVYFFYKVDLISGNTEIFAECPFTNSGPNEFTIKCN